MHIMLFGGSFDPPHNGHWQIANTIIERKVADQVWFIPCYSHPFSKTLSAPKHRLTMTNLLSNHAILVNDYEIKTEGTSYSYNTLKHFQTEQAHDKFSWLIGSDQLVNFHKWNNYQAFLKATEIYVYPREGFSFEPLYENMVALTDFPLITISSTLIRERVREKERIEDLVPEKVEEYINKKKLYSKS